MECSQEEAPANLPTLSPDCLGRIVRSLSVADLESLLLSSRALNAAVMDERVWFSLCTSRWGALTDLHSWLVPPAPPSPLRPRGMQPPSTYRWAGGGGRGGRVTKGGKGWQGCCQQSSPPSVADRQLVGTVPALVAAVKSSRPIRLHLPSCRRALYYLLHRTAPVVGLWRLVGEGPNGALVAFTWRRDGIKGEELQYDGLEEDMDCVPYRTVSPR